MGWGGGEGEGLRLHDGWGVWGSEGGVIGWLARCKLVHMACWQSCDKGGSECCGYFKT